jgi:peptidoglycan/xylan/chitin deacetylase (PgdA/CDA1 family)
MRVKNRISLMVRGLVSVLVFLGCFNDRMPTNSIATVNLAHLRQIDERFQSDPRICLWYGNKKAAYTIAFDDAKPSHYKISAVELAKRNMVGTFNINTQGVYDWKPWISLHRQGHEIASHSYSHPDLTTLTPMDLVNEFYLSKRDIMNNIPEIQEVTSFTYPYGLSNDIVRQIVLQYYDSARGSSGLNPATIQGAQFARLKGVGVYHPFNIDSVNAKVDEAIEQNLWIIVYFHAVTYQEENTTTCPYAAFIRHLDFVKSHEDDLWIATQRDVVKYIKLRQKVVLSSGTFNNQFIEVKASDMPDMKIKRNISYVIDLPTSWHGADVRFYSGTAGIQKYNPRDDGAFIFDIMPASSMQIFAYNK